MERPCQWTASGRGFDRLLGVMILELSGLRPLVVAGLTFQLEANMLEALYQ